MFNGLVGYDWWINCDELTAFNICFPVKLPWYHLDDELVQ